MSEMIEAIAVIAGLLLIALLPFWATSAVEKHMPPGALKTALLSDAAPERTAHGGSARSLWRGNALAVFLLLVIGALALFDEASRGVAIPVPAAVAFLAALAWFCRAAIGWHRASARLLSPSEQMSFKAALANQWFARYALAIVLICIALLVIDARPGLWWVYAPLALWVAILARELSFIVIVGMGLFLAIKGIASMPVSLAIVIGACIVAYTLHRRDRSA
jgi:hypothetical protein